MAEALIAEKMKKRSAPSGAREGTCPGGSAFFAMSFQLPHCLLVLQFGGWGQFSEKMLAFYKRLWFMAQIALQTTGVPMISFSPEEEAKHFGVSPNSIRRWDAFFVLNELLDPQDQKGGRGKKATFLFHSPPKKVIHIQTPPQEVVCVNYSTTPYGQPASQNKSTNHTSDSSTGCPKEPPTSPKSPCAAQQRAEKLRALPDETRVVGKFFNWVMEFYRHRCWENGCTREESDIICNAIGRQIKGKTLGEARKLATWFLEHVRHVIENLREALQKGLRAAYALLAYLFRKALGILKPNPKPYKKPASTAEKLWRWDLNAPDERKAFLDLVGNIIEQGGGLCPRCGNVVRVEYWEISSALAFKDPDGCRCLYIALDRESKEREEHHQLEKETREAQRRTTTESGTLTHLPRWRRQRPHWP